MRERERKEEEEEEEVEEEGVEEVEDIFRAAPNQLLRQFVSVGAKGRERERDTQVKHKKINMQPTRSLKAAAREEEIVKGRTGKQREDADTDETTNVEETRRSTRAPTTSQASAF